MPTSALAPLLALLGCGPQPHPDLDVTFAFPVLERERILPTVMGMDHDEVEQEAGLSADCLNYQGDSFPWCYDGHGGSDYDLDGGFEAMDADSATVIAAAPGRVVRVIDGNYDRCQLDLATFAPSCDGHRMSANRVTVLHDDGSLAIYAHFRAWSIEVEAGEWVERGDPLGLIGSSGYSTAPHLHFEVLDPDQHTFDPYAGPLSQLRSFWCEQEAPDGLPGPCPR